MEVGQIDDKNRNAFSAAFEKFKRVFFKENSHSKKSEVNTVAFKYSAFLGLFVFVIIVFLMPTESPVEFSEQLKKADKANPAETRDISKSHHSPNAELLWSSPREKERFASSFQSANHNTSMLLQGGQGNAKTQLNAGRRLQLRFIEKTTVTDDAVPIVAELISEVESESGLKLQAGTMFYGFATFRKGSERAEVTFTQIALLNGQLKKISAYGISLDGQPGVLGTKYSDGVRNTAGQLVTTFVGGLAAGSMESDMFGHSKGGVQNGLLGAIATTAQSRAQLYGEKLKTEREWLEIVAGTECEALLNESYGFQESKPYE